MNLPLSLELIPETVEWQVNTKVFIKDSLGMRVAEFSDARDAEMVIESINGLGEIKSLRERLIQSDRNNHFLERQVNGLDEDVAELEQSVRALGGKIEKMKAHVPK